MSSASPIVTGVTNHTTPATTTGTTTGDTMTTPTTLTPATTPDAPTTPDAYARRLRSAGFAHADADAIARDADARGAFPRPTPATLTTDAADDAAGAGWSLLALHDDGHAELLTTAPTAGMAAQLTAAYNDAHHGAARVVMVPTYDADAMTGAR